MKGIYNAEQHINFDTIKELLDKNKGKEILCFGGGTAAQILMDKLLNEYRVSCFMDNNSKLWGQSVNGIPICSADILKEKEKGQYIVLILSKHANQISRQLEEAGLKGNEDYFDIYREFSIYFRIKKFEKNVLKFLDFIDTIPEGFFKNYDKKGAKAGIVCCGTMAKNATCFAVAQCLVSMYHGYKPTLIVDTLKGYDDYIYFDSYHTVVRSYIDYIIQYLEQKNILIDVDYISESDSVNLTEEERNKLDYLSEITLSWLDSRRDEVFLDCDPCREEVSKKILIKNYGHIKYYFAHHTYDVLSVFTGLHKHRCLYTLAATEYNMRISTYDGGEAGHEIKVCTNGISTQSPDIKGILKSKMFTEDELSEIAVKSEELLRLRQNATVEDNANIKTRILNYQLAPQSENTENYDILVPLNIFWDSAALWVDCVFDNWVDWLKELISFVYNHTDATMLIREHPAQNLFRKFKYVDLIESIGYNAAEYGERIKIIKADAPVNTYSVLKKAKVVLPYTSTLGIEAAIMGKPVIMHTNIYYNNTSFVKSASTREEYFSYLTETLCGNGGKIGEAERKEALVIYFLKMKDMLPSVFTEAIADWMDYDFQELCEEQGVQRLMDCIYHGIPVCYNITKEILNK